MGDEPVDIVGTTLAGKYLVKRRLGAGGMGAVYEGEHVAIGKRVAIKVIHPMFAAAPEVAERFRREARAASLVESDGIVQVFDVGDDQAVGLYMVMELLQGEDLAQRLVREQRLPVPVALDVALQAARALAKAHAAGVVHRDLKPANLFLSRREDGTLQVKILDFGISKLTRDRGAGSGDETARTSPQLTRVGGVIGTPQYMSPEQAQGLAVDARTDVWSLGSLLFEALAGRSVFEEKATYEQTIIQIVTRRPDALDAVAPWGPAAVARLVGEALTPELDSRLKDCAAFADRLARLAGSGSASSDEPRALAPTVAAPAQSTTDGFAVQPSLRLKPRWPAALLLVALAATALVSLRLLRTDRGAAPASHGLVEPAELVAPVAIGAPPIAPVAEPSGPPPPPPSAPSAPPALPAPAASVSARAAATPGPRPRPQAAPPADVRPAPTGKSQVGGLGTTTDY